MPRGGARPVRTNSENKAVSGPGSLSERTDMQPLSAGQVPQSQIPSVPAPRSPASAPTPPTPVTNLFAPTERPEEPVTAGAPVGLGRTPEPSTQYGMIQKYMPQLEALASKEDAPESFRIFLGLVKSSISEGL
jgi:hypothetical protein